MTTTLSRFVLAREHARSTPPTGTLNIFIMMTALVFTNTATAQSQSDDPSVQPATAAAQSATPPPAAGAGENQTPFDATTANNQNPAMTLGQRDENEPKPWQVRIGDRAAIVHSLNQMVDIVVLVPDEAAFIDAISMWGFKNGRWPVLIEDDVYTPMFIRRYKPRRVLRWPASSAKGRELPSGGKLRSTLRQTLAWIWRNPDEARTKTDALATGEYDNPDTIYRKAGWSPPGVVITSVNDPAWPAALTLAAGYGQPITFLDGDFGSPDDTLPTDQFIRLNTEVELLVKQTGFAYDQLGDEIDTITIVRNLASKFHPVNINPDSDEDVKTFAVTDALARRVGGYRWGVAGWIYGSSVRSVYAAMSSLFIRPNTIALFDTYPDSEGWSEYRLNTVPATLGPLSIYSMLRDGEGADIDDWHTVFQSGAARDVLFMTSNGKPEWFKLTEDTWGYAQDMPIFNGPGWVYCVHSWSANRPGDINTVAGRCLDNGAIAYIGAVEEPFLKSFVPPGQLAERLKIGAPFIVSARFEKALPWKILTIGDPLQTFAPKGSAKIIPESFKPPWPNGTVDLSILIGEQGVQAKATGNWAPFFDSGEKLGRDQLVLRYYRKNIEPELNPDGNSDEPDDSTPTNRAFITAKTLHTVLPTLFRAEDTTEEFIAALASIPANERTQRELDMLWEKVNPELDKINAPESIEVLMTALRLPDQSIDAARLAPAVTRVLGPDRTNAFLDQCLNNIGKDNQRAVALINAARPTEIKNKNDGDNDGDNDKDAKDSGG